MKKQIFLSILIVLAALNLSAQQNAPIVKQIVRHYPDNDINVEYSFFDGCPKLNKLIKYEVNKFLKAAHNDDSIYPGLKKDFPNTKNEHTLRCVEVVRTADAISLLFERFDFSVGMAHPNTMYFTINYDFIHKKQLALNDVFDVSKICLDRISRSAIDLLIKYKKEQRQLVDETLVDKELIADGAGPEVKNFVTFLLKEAGIEFIFQPYQVGCYAEGISRILIPYADLKWYLRPDAEKTLKIPNT